MGKMGGGMVGGGGGDWGEETAGTMSAGWPGVGDSRSRAVGRVGTPGTPGSQWIPQKQDGWGKKVCMCVQYTCACMCIRQQCLCTQHGGLHGSYVCFEGVPLQWHVCEVYMYMYI